MQRLYRFLRALARNPKTTAAGVAGMIASVVAWVHDPAALAQAETWTPFIVGVGLLFAADSRDDSDQTPRPPEIPVESRRAKVQPITDWQGPLRLCA